MAISEEPASLTSQQRSVIITAWLTYAAYYLGRVNISTAIPALEADLGFSKGQAGSLLTGFFLIYAVSTLLNGYLGDRLSPHKLVFFGMLGSTGLNILFGVSSIWSVLLLIWCLNGYCQATGWGPILRTVANWLSSTQRSKISALFGSSFVAGNAITWLLSGWAVTSFGWRAAFWLPALLMLVMALIWFREVHDTPSGVQLEADNPPKPRLIESLAASFRHFWALSAAALFIGFIFGVFTLWSPTYFVDVGELSAGVGSSIASLLPLAGILGILGSGWVCGRYLVGREPVGLIGILVLLGLLCAAYPFVPFHLWTAVLLTMLIASAASTDQIGMRSIAQL
jgi:sugar phosphate permease